MNILSPLRPIIPRFTLSTSTFAPRLLLKLFIRLELKSKYRLDTSILLRLTKVQNVELEDKSRVCQFYIKVDTTICHKLITFENKKRQQKNESRTLQHHMIDQHGTHVKDSSNVFCTCVHHDRQKKTESARDKEKSSKLWIALLKGLSKRRPKVVLNLTTCLIGGGVRTELSVFDSRLIMFCSATSRPHYTLIMVRAVIPHRFGSLWAGACQNVRICLIEKGLEPYQCDGERAAP
ncbi:uncharacterized protein KNAG_0F03610 [Huiozyma naganishii CBS 8797]|uniref:Uncharacterized protein n=1 Tax=Huiozyma naganishii (strain ATCC MYA-139 / BCRC 22969 / CBS 8797 / KCTC 17520 / NBRC 10181 / NCYC 3082 / Yp74L-3) TaxID=1071383 RepID=J7RNB1_HUIN7|nr:hypothetical protein KNAG_0F03610 [Kazachstania naganishii CBS 8797]CCK71023.1 hypothetical protein KNAG_0F03610 [Kazachstania naganishii CBS 8797]